jgi:hypothetical protein
MTAAIAILRELLANSEGTRDTYDLGAEMRGRIKAALDAYDTGAPWCDVSPALQAEKPWCGWLLAFAHGSDWDTTVFGLEKLLNTNLLLTTSDGRSRSVNITQWQRIDPAYAAAMLTSRRAGDVKPDCARKCGIVVRELDTATNWEMTGPEELVPYEDIREIVVY